MEIRPVKNGDGAGIREVAKASWNVAYNDIYPQHFIDQFVDQAYSLENLEKSIIRDNQSEERKFYVCVVDDSVRGFAHVTREEEGIYELRRIYVQPDKQNRGIGRSLLHHLYKQIPHMNKLIAWVEEKNETGRRFYAREGFVQTNTMVEEQDGFSTKLIEYSWNR